jgi:hypothetical protein
METQDDDYSSLQFIGGAEDPRVQNGNAWDVHGPFEIPENVKKIYFPKFGWEIRRETRDPAQPKTIFFYTETRLNFAGHTNLSFVLNLT